ncbi:MAG: hypothetical protein H0V43_09620 [Gemmatimonadales bacterium]|nr:hypothetical protein [Gemmatimonadales bacterium]
MGQASANEAPLPAPAEASALADRPGRPHLVVVTTRALSDNESTTPGAALRTRFWHPRDRRWSENDFESLEHARRLFVEESGWLLLQEQMLDAPLAYELIFEAQRVDFARPSQEQILRDVGLTPESVNRMLEQVDRERRDQSATG